MSNSQSDGRHCGPAPPSETRSRRPRRASRRTGRLRSQPVHRRSAPVASRLATSEASRAVTRHPVHGGFAQPLRRGCLTSFAVDVLQPVESSVTRLLYVTNPGSRVHVELPKRPENERAPQRSNHRRLALHDGIANFRQRPVARRSSIGQQHRLAVHLADQPIERGGQLHLCRRRPDQLSSFTSLVPAGIPPSSTRFSSALVNAVGPTRCSRSPYRSSKCRCTSMHT